MAIIGATGTATGVLLYEHIIAGQIVSVLARTQYIIVDRILIEGDMIISGALLVI